MSTKKISESKQINHGYGAGQGDMEIYEYECPCGKSKIIEDMKIY